MVWECEPAVRYRYFKSSFGVVLFSNDREPAAVCRRFSVKRTADGPEGHPLSLNQLSRESYFGRTSD
jgi:hypothetical protein